MELFPEAELRNEVPVLVLILAFQVFKKPSSLTHKLEQTAAGSVVLGVGLEMVGQHFNAVGKEGDLNLRRSGVLVILAVLANDCLNLVLLFLYLSHFLLILSFWVRLSKHGHRRKHKTAARTLPRSWKD